MNNEEKFKESVRNLLDEREFSYDPSVWEEASRILDKKEKRKKRFLFLLFVGFGLGIVVLCCLFIPVQIENKPMTKQSQSHSSKQSTIKEKSGSGAAIAVDGEKKSGIDIQKNKIYKSNSSDEVTNQTKQSHLFQKNAQLATISVKEKQKTVPDAVNKGGQALVAELSLGRRKNGKNINKDTGVHDEDQKQLALSNEKTEHSDKLQPNFREESSKKTPDVNLIPGTVSFTQAEVQKPNEKLSETKVDVETMRDEKKIGSDVVSQETKDSSLVSSVVKHSPDTVLTAASQPTLVNPRPTNYFYAEGGAYLNFGWKYQGSREATSVNPYFGLSYLVAMGPKTAFSIGLYYTTVSKLKLDTKVIKSERIVYGEESDVIAITPTTLNYLLVPARFQYQLDKKQILTVGCNIGYLFDVRSNVETYTEKIGQQVNDKSYKTHGYVDGFITTNTQLALGYRRLLYKNLQVNGEVIYGLTDLRNNTFFGINFRERMTGIKISLTYDLLRK